MATNNKDFKLLKDTVDFYLQYKKKRNTMQMQSNYIKWDFSQKIKKHFQYLHLVKKKFVPKTVLFLILGSIMLQ